MRKKLIILGLVFSMVFSSVSLISKADENSELQNKNENDKKTIKSLQSEVDNKKEQNEEHEKKITEVSKKITDITNKIAETETRLVKLAKELEQNRIDLEDAQKKEEKTRNEMKMRIQFMYENGNTNLVVLLLQKDSLDDFLNSAEYKSSITKYDRQKLDEYIKVKEEIKLTKEKNTKLLEEQKEIKATLEENKRESDKLLVEHKNLIASNKEAMEKMQGEISELQKSIEGRNEQIQANIEAAKARLEALRNKNKAKNTPGSSVSPKIPSSNLPTSSGYIWPLPSGYTRISSPFSSGRRLVAADYINGGHLGTDIPAPYGTPIYSVRSGVVVWARYDGVSGNMVCIIQDDGRITRYAHMSSMAVSVNKVVSQGEVIGYVGQTGAAYGNHLHFQIESNPNAYFGTTAFDPMILYR